MLRIYTVCLDMVCDVKGVADQIGEFDRDQARQLRRSSVSVVLMSLRARDRGAGRGGLATTTRSGRREKRWRTSKWPRPSAIWGR